MTIEVNNKTEYGINDKNIKKTAEEAFSRLVSDKIIRAENLDLSIALVGEREMAGLNLKHRRKNEPTDVLSFSYSNEATLGGEIVLCPKMIENNAEEDQLSFDEELYKNIIHGVLHIAGLEHGEKMFAIQEGILSNVK